jgi:hypothetical protein
MRLVSVVLLATLVACRPPGWGRGDDDVDAGTGADASRIDAAIDATVASCIKAFRLDGHSIATSVELTGSFNNWAPSPPAAIAFTLGVDGAWTGSHTFAAGLHQYKFIVSGTQWIPDPTNPDGVDDGFGSRNSLYTCVP